MFSGLRVRYEKKEFIDFQVKCDSKYKKKHLKNTAIWIGKNNLFCALSKIHFVKKGCTNGALKKLWLKYNILIDCKEFS